MAESQSTRALALARRRALSSAGKAAMSGGSPQRNRAATATATAAAPAPAASPSRARARVVVASAEAGGSTRAVALARRKALSTQGKRADTSSDRTASGGPKARKAAAMALSVWAYP